MDNGLTIHVIQGNVAMVLDRHGEITQETHYYPYGEPWSQPQGQPWLFGDKEREARNRLGDYDFGARIYNAARCSFAQPDPLSEKYYHINPYTYCAADPINHTDPTGMEWIDNSQAERLKTAINKQIAFNNNLIENKRKSIDENSDNKKQNKLKKEIDELEIKNGYLNQSLSDIDRLAEDPAHKYTLKHIAGGEENVLIENGRVLIEFSGYEFAMHEIAHIRQALDDGGLTFSKGTNCLVNPGYKGFKNKNQEIENMAEYEVEAYKIQYSMNPRSLPKSKGCTIKKVSDININYVGNIYDTFTNEFIYTQINAYIKTK